MNSTALNEYYGTLSQTIKALNDLGYTTDFNIHEECLVCHKTNTQLSPDDFQIDKIYRFEGMSDPEDQSILYVISSPKYNIKGLLVNGYGIDSEEYSSMLVSKLNQYHSQNTRRTETNSLVVEPLVTINLQSLISQLKNSTTWKDKAIHSIIVHKADNMQMILMGLHKNALLKSHKAKGAISLQVLSGEIVFTTDEKSVTLEMDQMIALGEGITHSLQASEESFLLLTLAVTK